MILSWRRLKREPSAMAPRAPRMTAGRVNALSRATVRARNAPSFDVVASVLTGARLRRTSSSASSSIAARAVRRDSKRASGRRRSPAVLVLKLRPRQPLLRRAAVHWPPCCTFFT